MKGAWTAAIAMGLSVCSQAQWDSVRYAPRDTTPMLYDGGLDLHEGLYLSAKDLLRNHPSIPISSLVDKRGKPISGIVDSKAKTWKRKVYQRIDQGKRKAFSMNSLWGFCDKDHVYVKVPSSFQIGFKWFEVYHHRMITPLVRCAEGSAPDPPIWTTSEMFVLDMKTGTIFEVHADIVPELFQDDPGSLAAYNALPEEDRRSKRGMMDVIKRYNELHPLSLPR